MNKNKLFRIKDFITPIDTKKVKRYAWTHTVCCSAKQARKTFFQKKGKKKKVEKQVYAYKEVRKLAEKHIKKNLLNNRKSRCTIFYAFFLKNSALYKVMCRSRTRSFLLFLRFRYGGGLSESVEKAKSFGYKKSDPEGPLRGFGQVGESKELKKPILKGILALTCIPLQKSQKVRHDTRNNAQISQSTCTRFSRIKPLKNFFDQKRYYANKNFCFKESLVTIIVPKLFWYSILKTSYSIVRPLISFSRSTITITCTFVFLPVYPDRSNYKIRYSRNRLRQQIIPSIQFFFNPKVEKALFQFSEFYNKAFSTLSCRESVEKASGRESYPSVTPLHLSP